jgi:hypothetical protein
VVHGLQHRAVVRLTAAWQALPADGLAAFDALEDLLSAAGDFQLYRQTMKLRGNAATVPILSVCLHDLTVAYQRGAHGCLLANGMLSAAFMTRVGAPLRELLQFQYVSRTLVLCMHPKISLNPSQAQRGIHLYYAPSHCQRLAECEDAQ